VQLAAEAADAAAAAAMPTVMATAGTSLQQQSLLDSMQAISWQQQQLLQPQRRSAQQQGTIRASADVIFDALMGMPAADVEASAVMPPDVAAPPAAVVKQAQTRGNDGPAAAAAGCSRQLLLADQQYQSPLPGVEPGNGLLAAQAAAQLPLSAPAASATSQLGQLQWSQQQQQQQQQQLGRDGQQQQQQQQQQAQAAARSSDPLPAVVVGVEHHARAQHDYYAVTATLDFLAFIYLALFYQVAMKSARTLADLTDEKQLPWDYLSALLVLFVTTVIDRLVYSLGSHLGKFLLLLGQLLLFIPACMSLFWAPGGVGSSGSATSGTTREHLRVFIVLKACSWVTTCLQLRSGFPPRASFDGGGRQRFVFYSKPDVWHLMGFYAFQVRLLMMITAD
jgi:hypothetical protein